MTDARLVQQAVTPSPGVRTGALFQHVGTALLCLLSARGEHSFEVRHGAALSLGANVPLRDVTEAVPTATLHVRTTVDLLHKRVAPVTSRVCRSLGSVEQSDVFGVPFVQRQGFVFSAGQRGVRNAAVLAQLYTANRALESCVRVNFHLVQIVKSSAISSRTVKYNGMNLSENTRDFDLNTYQYIL